MILKSKVTKVAIVVFGLFIIFWFLPIVPSSFDYPLKFKRGEDFFIKKPINAIDYTDALTKEQADFWANQEDIKVSPKDIILSNGKTNFEFLCLNDYEFFVKWTTDKNLVKECDLLRKNNIKN